LSDAISISGYIPTSGDITVSTIEKLDLENMGIAVGIFIIGATELEIHVGGGNLTPPPLDIGRCKNTLDIGWLIINNY